MEENVISSFRGDYRFLSNFWVFERPIIYKDLEFNCVENAYVCAKTTDPDLWVKVQAMTPGKAKAFGKEIFAEELSINPDWCDGFRVKLVTNLVTQKFLNNSVLAQKLLATGNAELVEGNAWHDNFFGVCTCGNCPAEKMLEGGAENYLGKALMEVRNFLQGRL